MYSTMKAGIVGMLLALGAIAAVPASAADLPSTTVTPPAPIAPSFFQNFAFYTRIGGSGVFSDSHISSVTTLPGPFGTVSSHGIGSVGSVAALYLESGMYLTPNVAVGLSGGYPPTLTVSGRNSLAPAGTLAQAVVGLPIARITYHLTNFGPIRPYAGVGIGYAIVYHDSGAYLQYPALKSKAAFVLVGGVDYDITPHWSVFVDIKKIFLDQTLAAQVPGTGPFTGMLLPTTASVRTDPLLASLGIGYRF
ncbi:MAG: OmpW family outer membrane protein [Beijerinckiaceae bacterium]|nr:OmpW family outer membrane protein [Beijerinckiaceae bacterium]